MASVNVDIPEDDDVHVLSALIFFQPICIFLRLDDLLPKVCLHPFRKSDGS